MFEFLKDITFAYKELLWMLLIIPLLILWYVWKSKTDKPELKVSSMEGFDGMRKSIKQYLRHSLIALRLIGISFLIVVLARPQSRSSWKDVKTEGIDIVMCLDISGSMLSKDFKPNRIEAAKELAKEFIDARTNDRIGLVIFSGESFTQCPLTTDHAVIKNLFSGIHTGMVADGTAIGNGLATAVSRVKDSKAKSKVVILLTDGVNNQGSVTPLTAAEIAKTYGVRIYAIGIGTRGKALSPVGKYPNGEWAYDYVDVNIDEDVMTSIADMTGGKYFRATNNDKLKETYKEIDRLEKTIFEEKNFTNKAEKFFPFAIAAAISLLLEFLLRNTIFRSVP